MLSGIAKDDAQTLNPRVEYRGADFRTDASPSPSPNDGGYKRGKEILDNRNLNRLRNKCAMTRSAKEAGRKCAFTLAEVFSTHSVGKHKAAFTLAEVFSTHSAGYRKVAFTLAEVLITLGIIGVVAAMTLPTLIQHYKQQETSTRLKKFYSIMHQAIRMSELDNGEISSWEFGTFASTNPDDTEEEEAKRQDINRNNALTFFNKYIKSYIKYLKIDEKYMGDYLSNASAPTIPIKIYLSDGSNMYMHGGICIDVTYDTNGDKKPNIVGQDMFRFAFCGLEQTKSKTYTNGKPFGSFCHPTEKCQNREDIRKMCQDGVSSQDLAACTRLLEIDNWEFSSDYPYKI